MQIYIIELNTEYSKNNNFSRQGLRNVNAQLHMDH